VVIYQGQGKSVYRISLWALNYTAVYLVMNAAISRYIAYGVIQPKVVDSKLKMTDTEKK
jgi:hypothetical protein